MISCCGIGKYSFFHFVKVAPPATLPTPPGFLGLQVTINISSCNAPTYFFSLSYLTLSFGKETVVQNTY